jgi:hypothetical protein
MPRTRTTNRPPAAHERDGSWADPHDLGEDVVKRLETARVIATHYMRSVDVLERHAAQTARLTSGSFAEEDEEFERWVAIQTELRLAAGDKRRPKGSEVIDPGLLLSAWDVVGPGFQLKGELGTGKVATYTPTGWPPGMTYGDERWWQLRWRPNRRLDDQQKWLDRVELGANWWRAIKARRELNTEPKFNTWWKKPANGWHGVLWCANTADGRLPEPALANIVVVSSRSHRRIVTWSIYLPDPGWPPEAREHYVLRRMGGETDWKAVTNEAQAISTRGSAGIKDIVRDNLEARRQARMRRPK